LNTTFAVITDDDFNELKLSQKLLQDETNAINKSLAVTSHDFNMLKSSQNYLKEEFYAFKNSHAADFNRLKSLNV
jgi:hypothetical protein